MSDKRNVCFFVGTHGDWGGASRIIFNILRYIDRKSIEPIVMLTSRGPVCEELEERGIRYDIWQHVLSTNPLRMALHLRRAARYFRENSIALVVLPYGSLGWRPMEIFAAARCNIPVIQHCQRVIAQPSPFVKYTTGVITSSDYIARHSAFERDLVEPLIDIVDIGKFSNGVDIRAELGIPSGSPVIAFLGRARRSKGVAVFAALAEHFRETDVSFLLATQRTGKPNEDTLTDEQFSALVGSNPNIRHVPYRDDIENIYATADIVVMPSLSPEPCPAVALEAAASGTPIVAYDTGATSELVVNGETGILIPADDEARLLREVRRLLENARERESLGRRAAVYARINFFESPINRINEIYRTMVSSGRTTRMPAEPILAAPVSRTKTTR